MFFKNKIKIENGLLLFDNQSKDQIGKLIDEKKILGIRIYYPFIEECSKNNNFDYLSEIKGIKEISILFSDILPFDFLYKMKDLEVLTIQTVFSELNFENMNSK